MSSQNPLPSGKYVITNICTKTVLDSYQGKPDENNPVNGYQPHRGPTQQWQLDWAGTGSKFTLRNVQSGNYLSYSGRAHNLERVVTSSKPKEWIIQLEDKGYAIAAVENNLYVLDVTGSNPANETPVILYNNNVTDNQKWTFSRPYA